MKTGNAHKGMNFNNLHQVKFCCLLQLKESVSLCFKKEKKDNNIWLVGRQKYDLVIQLTNISANFLEISDCDFLSCKD